MRNCTNVEILAETRPNRRPMIGLVGLGAMGSRMAKRLVNAGYELKVYNRSPSAVKHLVRYGAKAVSGLPEIARDCRVIILSLPSTKEVTRVTVGRSGLLDCSVEGTIIIDTSTIDPNSARRIASRTQSKKVTFLDSPVSGGPEGAEAGTLTFMVGGERRAYTKIHSILRNLGKEIVYLGRSGAGQKMKLLNQALVACYFSAVAEAYRWSRRIGINSDKIRKVISNSWGDSPVFRHFMKVLESRKLEDGTTVRILKKDVSIIMQNAKKAGVRLKSLEVADEKLSLALKKGYGAMDVTALYRVS